MFNIVKINNRRTLHFTFDDLKQKLNKQTKNPIYLVEFVDFLFLICLI